MDLIISSMPGIMQNICPEKKLKSGAGVLCCKSRRTGGLVFVPPDKWLAGKEGRYLEQDF
jgi:hypothetical protein